VYSIFKVSHHWIVNVHFKDWKWKETVVLKLSSRYDVQRRAASDKNLFSTNYIWGLMQTDSGTEEDNIYHVRFTWILHNMASIGLLLGVCLHNFFTCRSLNDNYRTRWPTNFNTYQKFYWKSLDSKVFRPALPNLWLFLVLTPSHGRLLKSYRYIKNNVV